MLERATLFNVGASNAMKANATVMRIVAMDMPKTAFLDECAKIDLGDKS